jgi:hypothetical protein
MPQYKLAFRGDTRAPWDPDPHGSGIFQKGFESADYHNPGPTPDKPGRTPKPKQYYSLVVEKDGPEKKHGSPTEEGRQYKIYGDVNTATAVCMSSDIAAAAIFPQRNPVKIWIYAVLIDMLHKETVNAHSRQVASHCQYFQDNPDRKEPPPMYWYARELAVKKVTNRCVLGAVEVSRTFPNGGGDAVSFQVLQFFINPLCSADFNYIRLLVRYLKKLKSRGVIPTATIVDGFISTSKGRKLTDDEWQQLQQANF